MKNANENIYGAKILNQQLINNAKIIIPMVEEQQKIADYLDEKCTKIDTIIEKQQKIIEKLKEYKLSLITETVTKGLNPDVKIKDSGIEWIGKIPEHWQLTKIKYVIAKIGNIDHFMPVSVDIGYPYIMIRNLSDKVSTIDFSECKQVSEYDYDILSTKIKPIKDDVIFARYATIGTVCYVDIEKDFLVSYSCVTVRADKEKLFGMYLYYYFKSSVFNEDIKQYINSNTQENVGKESLCKAEITIPTLKEQHQITEYLDKNALQ